MTGMNDGMYEKELSCTQLDYRSREKVDKGGHRSGKSGSGMTAVVGLFSGIEYFEFPDGGGAFRRRGDTTITYAGDPMKPIIPPVPLAVWRNLYLAARKFQSLRPWMVLGDRDLIGIRDPSGGETGFGVVMGSAGTLFGFVLYLGAEGFGAYRSLMENPPRGEWVDSLSLQRCVKGEFTAQSDLTGDDLAIVRKLGMSFSGKNAWPQFRSLLPGYAPWFLTEAEARFLALGFRTACHHHERLGRGEVAGSLRDGECLVYTPAAGNEYNSAWESWPAEARHAVTPPVLDLARLTALRAKKTEPDSPWEADVFYYPSLIMDSERPYFMRIAAVCQESTGFAFLAEVGSPETPLPQMLADAICSSIEKHGFIPVTVFVKQAAVAAALMPLAKALGITVRARGDLGAVEMLRRETIKALDRTPRGRGKKR